MIALPQHKMKRLTAIHGWSGIVLGILLYAVVATGAVAVFAHEIGVWSENGARGAHPLEGPVDQEIRALIAQVDPVYHEEIGVSRSTTDALRVFFHRHAKNEKGLIVEEGVEFTIVPETGEVLKRLEGEFTEIRAQDGVRALERFLVDLHVQLYAPSPWGLILTGVLGLAMMAAGVSGLLMHKHAVRDLFVPDRSNGRLAAHRDRHTVAATWGLPFAFLLAFTGSFFSFAGSFGIPLLGMVAFGGDQAALIERVVGAPRAEDKTPAPLASLDYIIADVKSRSGDAPDSLHIVHYGRADAVVLVSTPQPQGALNVRTFTYDGVTREFLGERPVIGTTPSAGATALGLIGPLHFGNFAGVVSKSVWFALGVAMCFVILTGLRLWTRRREEDPVWRLFGRVSLACGYALPLAMIGSAFVFFGVLPTPADPHFWTPLGFLIVLLAGLSGGVLPIGDDALARFFRIVMGAALIALPLFRQAMGGMDWIEAASQRQATLISVDLLLLLSGLALFAWARSAATEPQRPAATTSPAALTGPAE